jgi:mono/diheme cytochrome c family protein
MEKALVLVPAILFLTAITPWAMEDASADEALWKSKCASCHGVDGVGNTAMGKKLKLRDLRSPEVQKMSDRELYDITAKGKEKMPAYEQKLTKDQIQQLVAHMRSLAKKK